MLPMGTIVTFCMLIGLIFASRLPVLIRLQQLPKSVMMVIGFVVLAAGLWNVLWYALRHLTEFWGIAALLSGSLMVITAGYIINEKKMPGMLKQARPLVQLLLLACMLKYGITIYQM
ncbi:hypothetical protein [Litoribacillus peritrichatus]|uniref:Uncharacterized protein n=1 Tax=Litoribacillus peritrichatus TaxID=718191 RepID=A0ABP7N3X4_9GAMM